MSDQPKIFESLNAPSHRLNCCALAVMAKAPRAGAVKTRLTPPLTPDEAAQLSACFLRDTSANIAEVARHANAQGVLVYAPKGSESAFDGLLPAEFFLLAQRGDDLSARLIHASEDLLGFGYESFCLIGSDSPTLPGEAIAAAARRLARAGDRVVLGPTDDGGYYLIGLKHAHHRLFADIEWSTERVLAQTMERAASMNLEVETLPVCYDVDDAGSLERLCRELLSTVESSHARSEAKGYPAPNTRDYLVRLIEQKGRDRIRLNASGAEKWQT